MQEFFIRLGNQETYKKLLKEPLTYVAGAMLLAILNIAHFAVLNSGWGVTSPFVSWGAWLVKIFGVDVSGWSYFSDSARQTLENGFLRDGGSIRNLGIIFGALLATLYASQFKIKKIKSGRQVIAAILGGLMMGYGARMASGCNIGALFTGTASLSLSGWIFAGALLIGAYFGSKLLAKYFM
jgi:uncharacterized membrane protein YedE/YeeE